MLERGEFPSKKQLTLSWSQLCVSMLARFFLLTCFHDKKKQIDVDAVTDDDASNAVDDIYLFLCGKLTKNIDYEKNGH